MDIKIIRWSEASKEEKDFILTRSETDITEQMELALQVIKDIKARGDEAVLEYTAKYDGVKITKMKVEEAEIEKAYLEIDGKLRDTLEYAADNIKRFHAKQLPEEVWLTEIDKGLLVGEKVTPITDVCLYVPRGKGSFPSVLLMLGAPAVVAGVEKIVVVTPPNENGEVDKSILACAKILGLKEIYMVGGIQAVAAVAYGTETIPRCRKIIGPGNTYVTAAKRVLVGQMDIGLPAGPSEGIILADAKADPEKVALDLMIEAEHGIDSAALLVTHSEELISRVSAIVERQLTKLSEKRRAFVSKVLFDGYGGAILTNSLEDSIAFVNDYAPEHMEVMTSEPFDVLPKIKNAGEILLGHYTPITLCNFLLGPNAILPTGGFAKTVSSVSIHDFIKRSSVGYASKEGFARVKEYAAYFANIEGFEAHELAVKERVIADE